ncbi:glycosyltransferase [Halogeometricum borinquense]|uniref:Glycosyltransferase n=1 Tax=Halogeometricum borinquense TaxID=60847 RepID=A0A6C0UDD9_9EURY|nr:glycosyltransferase [Halogeometricum borinquense]QIB73335.1 glycosyltransferase [Halogeometricum borinquense]QIQ77267.1 glycosyltransferase [Halogeometricum borinquense]
MTRSVGVVVPAYRPDSERLADYVSALRSHLSPATVRIELDAPRPGVLDRLADLPATVNAVDTRRGKGAAITAGFEAIADDVDVLAFADADGSTPAASFASVVKSVAGGDADLAVGSRRHPASDVASHQTFARRRLGDGFAWMARRLLDVHLYDYQCGAKALTTEAWRAVRPHIYEAGFAWDIELIAVAGALGERIAEVPVRWEDRPGSTVSPVDTSYRLARALFSSRHRARLIREDRLHTFIESTRDHEPALVERLGEALDTSE